MQAFLGHYEIVYSLPRAVPQVPGTKLIIDETSGWSNTQTLIVGGSQTLTPSPETTLTPPKMGPTSSPNQEPLLTPEQPGIIVGTAIAVAVICAGLGLLIYFIKRK